LSIFALRTQQNEYTVSALDVLIFEINKDITFILLVTDRSLCVCGQWYTHRHTNTHRGRDR